MVQSSPFFWVLAVAAPLLFLGVVWGLWGILSARFKASSRFSSSLEAFFMLKPKSPEEERTLGLLITFAIGNLVINWSNNESVFLAMLRALLGGSQSSAAIIWYSLSSTRIRLNLISRLSKEHLKNATLCNRIEDAKKKFKPATTARNFYCHAHYGVDVNQNLKSAQGHSWVEKDPNTAIEFPNKPLNKARLNEIRSTVEGLAEQNTILWDLLHDIENELGVRHVKRPPRHP